MKLIDLTGKQFGKLTVIIRDLEYQKIHNKDKPYWKCQCQCGNIVTVSGKNLREGKTKSCGCINKERVAKLNFINRINQKYGKLTALEYIGNSKWKCKCDCGTILEVTTSHLTTNHTLSCGCLRSKGELFIKNFLNKNNINYKNEYTGTGLRNSNGNLIRFDFAIFDKNDNLSYFIEYNGRQHYDKNDVWYSESIVESDKIKQDYAKKNKIPLIVIDEGQNIEKILLNIIDFSKILD